MGRGAAISMLALACFACAARGPNDRLAPPVLGDDLVVGSPEAVGLRRSTLTALLAGAEAEPDLRSILVARQGRLVLEAYFNGTDRDTLADVRSVGKSITATLVGIAQAEGRLGSLDQPFLNVLGDVPGMAAARADPVKAAVTIRQLLEMRSGFAATSDWVNPNAPSAEDRMAASADWLRYALELPMATAPGTTWAYASLNAMLLGRVVAAATGVELEAYARAHLFAPLHFGAYCWSRDPQGIIVAQGSLWMRPRDLLKLGLLYLGRGSWHGRALVPAAFVADATRAHLTLPLDPASGQGDLYKGYGYQWWTSEEKLGETTLPVFLASGSGGQKLFVVPSLQLAVVVIRTPNNRGPAHVRSHALFRKILAATR
jgi:CubicO group peptidase (beta-lactamase class C family)